MGRAGGHQGHAPGRAAPRAKPRAIVHGRGRQRGPHRFRHPPARPLDRPPRGRTARRARAPAEGRGCPGPGGPHPARPVRIGPRAPRSGEAAPGGTGGHGVPQPVRERRGGRASPLLDRPQATPDGRSRPSRDSGASVLGGGPRGGHPGPRGGGAGRAGRSGLHGPVAAGRHGGPHARIGPEGRPPMAVRTGPRGRGGAKNGLRAAVPLRHGACRAGNAPDPCRGARNPSQDPADRLLRPRGPAAGREGIRDRGQAGRGRECPRRQGGPDPLRRGSRGRRKLGCGDRGDLVHAGKGGALRVRLVGASGRRRLEDRGVDRLEPRGRSIPDRAARPPGRGRDPERLPRAAGRRRVVARRAPQAPAPLACRGHGHGAPRGERLPRGRGTRDGHGIRHRRRS